MAKLLETKLPTAIGPIDPAIFNRLVRVLELSLNRVDVGSTVNVNETERNINQFNTCLLYTSPSPRDGLLSRMPSSA